MHGETIKILITLILIAFACIRESHYMMLLEYYQ